ncbi:uncharacterized protein METZ01_LOCUS328312, partial [marine metagenome]
MAARAGFEPATKWLTATCSTTELPGNWEAIDLSSKALLCQRRFGKRGFPGFTANNRQLFACHDLPPRVNFSPFLPFQAMNIQKLEVTKRENFGRGHSRRLRKSGRIPIVFYSKSRNERYSLAEPDFRV